MAVQIYVANRGISKAEAMRRAGYAEATARNPKNLTKSPSWQELMDEYLPDESLAKKHKALLEAKKIERTEFPSWLPEDEIRAILLDAGCKPRNYETNPITGVTVVWYWAPDSRAQAAALDLAYKLKGKLAAIKMDHTVDTPVALVEFLGGDGTTPSQG